MKNSCKIGIVTNAHYRAKILNNILQVCYPEFVNTESTEMVYSSMFLKHNIRLRLSNADIIYPKIKFNYTFDSNGNSIKLVTFINSIILKASNILKDIVFKGLGTDAENEDIFKTFMIILSDIAYNDYKLITPKGYTLQDMFNMFNAIRQDSTSEGLPDPCIEMVDDILNTYSIQELYNMYIRQNPIYMSIFTALKQALKLTLISNVPYNTGTFTNTRCLNEQVNSVVLGVATNDIYKTLITFIQQEGSQPLIVDYIDSITIDCSALTIPFLRGMNLKEGSEVVLLGGNVKGTNFTNSVGKMDYLIFLENKNRLQRCTLSKDMFSNTVRNADHNSSFFINITDEQSNDLNDLNSLKIANINNFNNMLSELMSEGSIVKCVSSEIPDFLPFKGIEQKVYINFPTPQGIVSDEDLSDYLNEEKTAFTKMNVDTNKFFQSVYSNISNKGTNFSLPVEAISFGKSYSVIDLNDIDNIAEFYLKINDSNSSLLNKGSHSNLGLSLLESQNFITFTSLNEAWDCISELIQELLVSKSKVSKVKSKIDCSGSINLNKSVIDSVIEDSSTLCYDILKKVLIYFKKCNNSEAYELILSLIEGDTSDKLTDCLENYIFENVVRRLNMKELSCLSFEDSSVLRETLRHNLHSNIKNWLRSFRMDNQAKRHYVFKGELIQEPKAIIKAIMNEF